MYCVEGIKTVVSILRPAKVECDWNVDEIINNSTIKLIVGGRAKCIKLVETHQAIN